MLKISCHSKQNPHTRWTLKGYIDAHPHFAYCITTVVWVLAPNIAWRIGSQQRPDGWASSDFGGVIWFESILYIGLWQITIPLVCLQIALIKYHQHFFANIVLIVVTIINTLMAYAMTYPLAT